jgi:gamma-glutamyl phosphate reductase
VPQEAVEHIHRFGSRHSEAIITEDIATAKFFLSAVLARVSLARCGRQD